MSRARLAIRPHHRGGIDTILAVFWIQKPDYCPVLIAAVVADLIGRALAIPIGIQSEITTHPPELDTIHQALVHILTHPLR
jgi:hypothetical protein